MAECDVDSHALLAGHPFSYLGASFADGGCRLGSKTNGGVQDKDWTLPKANCKDCKAKCLAADTCVGYECHGKEPEHCELWKNKPTMTSGNKDGYQCWLKE